MHRGGGADARASCASPLASGLAVGAAGTCGQIRRPGKYEVIAGKVQFICPEIGVCVILLRLYYVGSGVCSIFLRVDRPINEIHKLRALFSTKVCYKKYVFIYY
jgi:hypothetical protein